MLLSTKLSLNLSSITKRVLIHLQKEIDTIYRNMYLQKLRDIDFSNHANEWSNHIFQINRF